VPGRFLPAGDLSARLYRDAVRPLLGNRPHAAALLGWGSDVLGYDTPRSTDHGWGPRLLVFLDTDDEAADLRARLDDRLPDDVEGWPVRFGWDGLPVTHHVTVTTLPAWLTSQLGLDATAGMSTTDWLVTPQQRLLGVVAGRVHADPDGVLAGIRRRLNWYPDPVWRWLLACQWHRLAQEEAFVARTAEVGDETGSAVVAARLVRDMMRLALLLDRRYAPYQKWLGTAFARSRHDDDLPRHLADALRATEPGPRGDALAEAYVALAGRHAAAGLTEAVDARIRGYHERPAQVLMADRFAEALLGTVTDDLLAALPLIGGVDQLVDSTDALSEPALFRRLARLYGPGRD
jgi:hypothetical protein